MSRRVKPPLLKGGYGDVHIGAELNADEVEFARAIDAYRRKHGRPFPTCHEILAIARQLGYRKVADSSAEPHRQWLGPPDPD
jgi:hypothetical protein